MSGHSHWAGIKHKKGVTDQKRGQLFSKLCMAITAAARSGELNPDFNPRLRSAVAKARENKVPAENIERAIKRASEAGQNMEELIFEAYGPGGSAIIIEAVTDSSNRTVAEIKKLLKDNEGKWAETGSVRWVFEAAMPSGAASTSTTSEEPVERWQAKFPQELDTEDQSKLIKLLEALEDHPDVQETFTNAVMA